MCHVHNELLVVVIEIALVLQTHCLAIKLEQDLQVITHEICELPGSGSKLRDIVSLAF